MLEKVRKEKCPNCKKEVEAKLIWRENGEGEYICPKCNKMLILIKRRD